MEVTELLKKLEEMKAPPGFEHQLLTRLEMRKGKERRTRVLRLFLAGVFSASLVFLIVWSVLLLTGKGPVGFANLGKGFSVPAERVQMMERLEPGVTIPITESVDYSGEVRRASQEPRTIYLLEQVSDTASPRITY